MKRIVSTISIILLVVIAANAQINKLTNPDINISNSEKFSETSGALIQKEFIDVGRVSSTTIQIEILTDLITGKKVSAVRFDKGGKIGVIDADELDGLIKSLKIIFGKISLSNVSNYTEIAFTSRSGFSTGCYWSKNKWSTFLKTKKYDDDSYDFFDKIDNLNELQGLLDQAKLKMI